MGAQPIDRLRTLLAGTDHHPFHAGQAARIAPVTLGRTVWPWRAVSVLKGGTRGARCSRRDRWTFQASPQARCGRQIPATCGTPERVGAGCVRP
jgi:hypothetical protein